MTRLAWTAAGLALILSACGAAPGTEPSSSASVGPSNSPQSPPPLIPTSPPAPVGPTTSAVVTRVADGQTIEVALDGRSAIVRYIGIAIPVSTGPTSSAPNIPQQATAANSGLVARQTVILEQDVSNADASGRLLRYVWVQNGGRLTLVNLALVSLGLARAASAGPDMRYDELLRAAENEARDAQRGLWAGGTSGMTASPAPSAPGASAPAARPAASGPRRVGARRVRARSISVRCLARSD